MIADFTVDGINAMNAYGVYIVDDSLCSVLSFPPLKAPDVNDWAECDGLEVDLSEPVLDKREIQLKLFCSNKQGLDSFVESIREGLHEFYFLNLNARMYLRYAGMIDYDCGTNFESFTLSFSDDFPLHGYVYSKPTETVMSTGLKINGNDIRIYGLLLLDGSKAEIEKRAELKPNLVIESKYKSGVKYDFAVSKNKAKDVKLMLCFTHWSYDKQNAFLYDLVRPGERLLTYNGIDYKFYYKSGRVTKFASILVIVEINLMFIN